MPSRSKDDDRITFRADKDQLAKLVELEKLSKDLKMSNVIRTALRFYFASEEARLPNGELVIQHTQPIPKKPKAYDMSDSPDAQTPAKVPEKKRRSA